MGRDSKPYSVRAGGVEIGEIVVTRVDTGRAMSLTADLLKLVGPGLGSLSAIGANAITMGGLFSSGVVLPEARLIDADQVSKAIGAIAQGFPDGLAFVKFCKSWLRDDSGGSRVRFYRGTDRSDWIDLGSEEAWRAGGDDMPELKGGSPALMLSGVIASIQANTYSFTDTFDIPGMSKVMEAIREILKVMKAAGEFSTLFMPLLSALREKAESMHTPGESQEGIPPDTGNA